jgi:hypothetical protein
MFERAKKFIGSYHRQYHPSMDAARALEAARHAATNITQKWLSFIASGVPLEPVFKPEWLNMSLDYLQGLKVQSEPSSLFEDASGRFDLTTLKLDVNVTVDELTKWNTIKRIGLALHSFITKVTSSLPLVILSTLKFAEKFVSTLRWRR